MKTKKIIIIAIPLILFWTATSLYAGDNGHAGHHKASEPAQVHQGHGTVESVDMASATVRMEHEPIESLRWPKMVMDLKAENSEMLNGLKQGDRITFDLVRTDKGFIITRIEKHQ